MKTQRFVLMSMLIFLVLIIAEGSTISVAPDSAPLTSEPLIAGEFSVEAARVLTPGAVFTVNTTIDVDPPGECTAEAGGCSLREAIIAANNGAGQDTVEAPGGAYNLSAYHGEGPAQVDATQGDLEISDSLVIRGTGPSVAVIDGMQQDRVFAIVTDGIAVQMERLTIRNGQSDNGGGINNSGDLTLINTTVANNVATNVGGGVYNTPLGALSIVNSTFTENGANASFGGGGIRSDNSVSLTNTIIANSTSGRDCRTNYLIDVNDHNLVEDGSCTSLLFGDPGLGAYENGYYPLTEDSQAIDAGNDATCDPVDELGVTRPLDGDGDGTAVCDIGAIEAPTAPEPRPTHTPSPSTLQVNTFADVNNLCQQPPVGDCSLREAIMMANWVPGQQTILVPAGTYNLERVYDNNPTDPHAEVGDLDINDDTVITGAGSTTTTIVGGGTTRVFRVFQIATGITVEIRGVKVTNGRTPGGDGGGIFNQGDLTLVDVNVTGNHSPGQGGGIANDVGAKLAVIGSRIISNISCDEGAGIANRGELTVRDSTIASNHYDPDYYPEFCYWLGGGVYNGGGASLTMQRTTFSGNISDVGAGLVNYPGGTAAITDSTFDANTAVGGGAIYNGGALTVANTRFLNNAASYLGGGVGNEGNASVVASLFQGNTAPNGAALFNHTESMVSVENSTLAANPATEYGGAVHNRGDFTLKNSTLKGNGASLGGGGVYNSAAALSLSVQDRRQWPLAAQEASAPASLHLYNTLIADSASGGDCVNDGALSDNDHNLIRDGSCSPFMSGDPLLGAYYDGYYPLRSDSAAIDAGNNATCPLTDQRGLPRPVDGNNDTTVVCDIGAIEHQGLYEATDTPTPTPGTPTATPTATPTPFTIHVNTTIDSNGVCQQPPEGDCSLREAILLSNDMPGQQTVLVPGGQYDLTEYHGEAPGTYDPNQGDLEIYDSVAILGSGSRTTIIDGQENDRVIFVVPQTITVQMERLTVQHGKSDNGGGINNNGNLTLVNVTLSHNAVTGVGGGIINAWGTLTMINSTLAENTAGGGGGGIQNNQVPLHLRNTLIANNGGGDCRNSGGTIVTNDHTLIGDGSCPSMLTGDAGLSPYANGYYSLQSDSKAIDAGNHTWCTPTDQIEHPRVDGNGDDSIICDIGAIEAPPYGSAWPTDTPTPTPTLTPTDTPTPTPSDTPTPTLTPTETPTPTPSTTIPIFADGFESGNLSAWSSAVTGGGDLSVTAAAALQGSRGMQAAINDNTSLYVRDLSPVNETHYGARFLFDPNGIVMTSGDMHTIFSGRVGSIEAVRVLFRRYNATYQVRVQARDDAGTYVSGAWYTISDGPHSIEIESKAATAAGANNGLLSLRLDGVLKETKTGIDNDTLRVDEARLGPLAGIDTGTRGVTYFDGFESWRPSGPTPTPSPVPEPTLTPTLTPTFTPTLTPTPGTPTHTPTPGTPGGLIFADGFESGNFSAWSSVTTGGGDLSVTAAAALKGSKGMQANINDNTALYVKDTRPASETRYNARFYFDPNTITMTSGDTHNIFTGRMGTVDVLRVVFRRYNTSYQVRAQIRTDAATYTSGTWYAITDAAQAVEIEWKAATGAGANNGSIALWLDGVLKQTKAGIDNDTLRVDEARLGPLAGIDTGTRGVMYFDAFESRRTGYIGLAAGASLDPAETFGGDLPIYLPLMQKP